MKLRLHHIEICVSNPGPLIKLLCDQFGFNLIGYRETHQCVQFVLKLSKTVFIVTSRKGKVYLSQNNNICDENGISGCWKDHKKYFLSSLPYDSQEYWTVFCCKEDQGDDHIDSVFNVAVEVENLTQLLKIVRKESGTQIIQDVTSIDGPDGRVEFAIIKSCCGNVVHTTIQKSAGYTGWFLPGFHKLSNQDPTKSHINGISMSHFDHFTLACKVGETDGIINWYESIFGMKRFITNRQDLDEEGLVIGDDVGLRLKVMEFWKCSESGLASQSVNDTDWEPLKIVIAESLPNITNTQIESFISEHGSPGIQHVGLHTENMVDTVRELTKLGVKFRHPPPTYYTEIGQLDVIKSSGEDVNTMKRLGILLDNEADVFDQGFDPSQECYLMQVFTHPIFERDTFFLEVIQRRGATGFGVGNVTALARSVNAYKDMMKMNGMLLERTEERGRNTNNDN